MSATGLPVVASGAVDDHALLEVAYLADLMLAKRPDVRAAMIANGSRVIIMGRGEFTTDIPEYAHMKPKDYWDARARGLGGSETDPVCSCAEENVLAFPGIPTRPRTSSSTSSRTTSTCAACSRSTRPSTGA